MAKWLKPLKLYAMYGIYFLPNLTHMSPHYLVIKHECSKFLPNTGFVTIRLLRFGVKVKIAYCRDNFLAKRPLPDMRRLCGNDFLCFNGTATRCISTRHRRFPGAGERCEIRRL